MHTLYAYLILFVSATLVGRTLEYAGEEKLQVKVGALFFKGEDEVELSFDQAFREINSNKLFEINFMPIKRFLGNDDSFILQQLTCELIASGVAAIFGPSSKASSDIVALIANATGIPHMQYDWINKPTQQVQQNHQMSVNVAPSIALVARAYLDIIKSNYEWKTFTIVYETDEALVRLQDLLDIQALNVELIKLRKISDFEDDIRVLWKEAAETFHEQRLVLDCTPEALEDLLNAAMPFNLLGPFKNWFFTHLDTHSSRLKNIYNKSFMANMTSVRLKTVDPNPYERKKTHVSRVDSILGNKTMLPLLMYDAVILYTNSVRNVMTSMRQYQEPRVQCSPGYAGAAPWYWGPLIVQEMKTISEDDVEPKFKTERMRLNEIGQRDDFVLEIYKPTVNEPLATWRTDGTIAPQRSLPAFEATSNAEDFSQSRKMFTVVTHYEEPYFMKKENAEIFRGIEKFEGYAVDLIQKLSEILDFEYEFLIVNGNGKYNPETKKWDGIIQKLIDHEAQIGVCDLTITQTRREVVDFTVPFMQLGISILGFKSPPEPKDLFAFLQPFALEVWVYMMLTQLAMTILFVFMARISNHEWETAHPCNQEPDEVENKWNTMNSVWLMVGSIMQQGCDILPRGPPMRILNAMWWFFALMMLSTYTANFTAFLTNNKIKSTINNLDDLIDQDKVQFGAMFGGSTSLFFSDSNHTAYQKAWNQMKSFTPSAFTKTNKEGVERVRKGKGGYAFLMETTSMSYNIERNCELMEIGKQIGEKHYGLAVPLGAEYRSNLSVSILKLSEKGELYKLKNKWWKNHNVTCEEPHAVDGDELSIIELGGVFLVLGGGILIALTLGLLEFLWNVQSVAVQEKVTPGEAFKAELIFAFKFWIKRKPMRISSSSAKSSRVQSRRSSRLSKQSRQSRSQSRSAKGSAL